MAKDNQKDHDKDPKKGHKKNKDKSYGPEKAAKSLNKQVKSAAKVEYGPQFRENKSAVRESKRVSKSIKPWWKDYDRVTKEAQHDTSQAYGSAAQNINQTADANYQHDINASNARETERKAEAEKSGQTYVSSGDAEKAAAAREQYQAQNAGLIGTLGANNTSYFADARRIGVGARNQALQAEQRYRKDLRKDKRDLTREKSRFQTDYASKLRQESQQAATEAAAFGLDQASLQSLDSYRKGQLKNTAKGRKADRKESNKDRRFEREENQKDRDSRERMDKNNGSSGKNEKGLDTTDKRNLEKTLSTGKGYIKNGAPLADTRAYLRSIGVQDNLIRIAMPKLKKYREHLLKTTGITTQPEKGGKNK